jgi:hypothetical protein
MSAALVKEEIPYYVLQKLYCQLEHLVREPSVVLSQFGAITCCKYSSDTHVIRDRGSCLRARRFGVRDPPGPAPLIQLSWISLSSISPRARAGRAAAEAGSGQASLSQATRIPPDGPCLPAEWRCMMTAGGSGDGLRSCDEAARKNQLLNHDLSIKYSRQWSKAGPPLSPTCRKPVDACQVHQTKSEKAEATGNKKMKPSM